MWQSRNHILIDFLLPTFSLEKNIFWKLLKVNSEQLWFWYVLLEKLFLENYSAHNWFLPWLIVDFLLYWNMRRILKDKRIGYPIPSQIRYQRDFSTNLCLRMWDVTLLKKSLDQAFALAEIIELSSNVLKSLSLKFRQSIHLPKVC